MDEDLVVGMWKHQMGNMAGSPMVDMLVFLKDDMLELRMGDTWICLADGSLSVLEGQFLAWVEYREDPTGTSSQNNLENNMNQHGELVIRNVKTFTYDELKLATRDFGNDAFLGEGRCGKVYKCWVDKTTYSPCKVDTGLPVVVKKLHRYKLSNLEMLEEFRHPNLVKLIGCCMESGCLFLVYEFIRKGNLEDLLRNGAVARLLLVTKVKILIEIARGVFFLQKAELNKMWPTATELHRHKILLDEDFTAKLSDYDVTYIVNGQYDIAYPDYEGPELVLQSNLSGYEVVFVEVLTGERLNNSKIVKIDRLFRQNGKESLHHIAQLCLLFAMKWIPNQRC
ncbi:serine/threonine-protein kinase BIK1-like [Bidens hawaiensis]|uniref:serine/threonine-protein kinase BIK1-like n=1 Tax=Bidens hawaiensis TaxID=980011 RepID=UPI00404B9CA3